MASFSWVSLWAILSKAGTQAPAVAALLMAAFNAFELGVEKLSEAATLLGISLPAHQASGPVALSVEESDAQRQCLIFLHHHSGSGTGLQASAFGDRLGNFLKNNPWVTELLAGLIRGAITGGA